MVHAILTVFALYFSANSYIENNNSTDFLKSELVQQRLLVSTMDLDLMNATVFHLINEKRKNKGIDTIAYNRDLAKTAAYYQSKFEFRRFLFPEKVERKIDRDVLAISEKNGFKGGLVLPVVGQENGINYEKGKPFFFDKNSDDSFGIYYGEKPKKNEENDRDLVEAHTYLSFAEDLLKKLDSPNEKKLYSKAYNFGGVSVQWYYKTLKKNKIPQMKMVFILGGYQTAGMWEE